MKNGRRGLDETRMPTRVLGGRDPAPRQRDHDMPWRLEHTPRVVAEVGWTRRREGTQGWDARCRS